VGSLPRSSRALAGTKALGLRCVNLGIHRRDFRGALSSSLTSKTPVAAGVFGLYQRRLPNFLTLLYN